eukprot:CAMPEP_0115325204 /NCGR_PEP_ID=MMETSP0270-20121206/82889_1 /TAXON_ID=71861 /ORGANISM="Scrippsiella trochoidea, Strain CCMP3099" /LENGTH=612 /DNA_ID=CAMNT_0002745377 /DNA_START=156 /DNA_END=1994 /DNA_ORIENTATION=-
MAAVAAAAQRPSARSRLRAAAGCFGLGAAGAVVVRSGLGSADGGAAAHVPAPGGSAGPSTAIPEPPRGVNQRLAYQTPVVVSTLVVIGLLPARSRHRRLLRCLRRASTTSALVPCSVAPQALAVVHGVDLHPVALRRGRQAQDDILLVRCRLKGERHWRMLDLRRDGHGYWANACGVEESRITLRKNDAELAAEWLPVSISAQTPISECAPSWPEDVHEALTPWPLKGCGTIVFDAQYFLESACELLAGGQGPLLFPGGAEQLALPSMFAGKALQQALSGTSMGLAELFLHGVDDSKQRGGFAEDKHCKDILYEDLLDASEAVSTGLVDLTRARLVGTRRTCRMSEWPYGFLHIPRTWAHGVVLRDLEPLGEAELAGCRRGDVVIAANGQPTFDAPAQEAAAAVELPRNLALEVQQPVLEGPFYLRDASVRAIGELAGVDAEEAVLELVPRLSQLLAERGGDGGNRNSLSEEDGERALWREEQPSVFAGDGGSASQLHADTEPRVQFCHVLHGIKLFAIEHDPRASGALDCASAEVSFPVDLPLAEDQGARWLASPGVSVAACRAGDLLCFWGGDQHCGANALGVGPCVALFHAYEWPLQRDNDDGAADGVT